MQPTRSVAAPAPIPSRAPVDVTPATDASHNWRIVTPRAEISATAIGAHRWRISSRSLVGSGVPRGSCDTTFPRELVERLLNTTAPEWICDTIARHEDPAYIRTEMRTQLFAYFPPSAYAGRRLLDFGCGSGASTMAIAELLPDTDVVGVVLNKRRLSEADAILEHRALANARFMCSPSGEQLPAGIGSFAFVMLSAVFEHLLPAERGMVMPLLWSHMRPGAVIFVNQTPHRWHPYEHHSTRLWGINYLPDGLAERLASRYGARTRGRKWPAMLRGGIRGGTERSMRMALTGGHLQAAEVIQPNQNGLRDRADYWLSCTSPRQRRTKRLVARLFRLTDQLFGTMPTLNVSVAIRKRE
jgi:predicted O-methyltransferase YrrM